jgi:hypothetical protein
VTPYSQDGIYVIIKGNDVYETLRMPQVPSKGDILWLSSLTRGRSKYLEAQVSRIEWAMDQRSGTVTAWLTVRVNHKVQESLEKT